MHSVDGPLGRPPNRAGSPHHQGRDSWSRPPVLERRRPARSSPVFPGPSPSFSPWPEAVWSRREGGPARRPPGVPGPDLGGSFESSTGAFNSGPGPGRSRAVGHQPVFLPFRRRSAPQPSSCLRPSDANRLASPTPRARDGSGPSSESSPLAVVRRNSYDRSLAVTRRRRTANKTRPRRRSPTRQRARLDAPCPGLRRRGANKGRRAAALSLASTGGSEASIGDGASTRRLLPLNTPRHRRTTTNHPRQRLPKAVTAGS
ncbi:hypothetical protein CDD83_3218 [Cordyceps sp. RAO-2017]|nr:hypothetical protein CDD83_3218 [Cordyceps sp. RAO-2017]